MEFELFVCNEIEKNILINYEIDNYLQKKDAFIIEFKRNFIESCNKVTSIYPIIPSYVKIRIKSSTSDLVKASLFIEEVDSKTFSIHLFESLFIDFIVHGQLPGISDLLLHELIHYLDVCILKETKNEFTLNKFKFQSINSFHSSVQWLFIHFLSTVRNEGVAILGEKILTENQDFLGDDEAFLLFENDLDLAISLCHSTIYRDKLDVSELKKIISTIEINTYRYADVILFNFLKNNSKITVESNLKSYISNETPNESKQLLEAAFHFDLSEWIRELFKIEIINEINFQIDYLKLSDLCQFLISDNAKENNDSDLEFVLLYAYQNEKKKFIDFIRKSSVKKIEFNDIKQTLEQHVLKLSNHDISIDVLNIANDLIASRDFQNHELIDWALTYFLNKSDILNDELSFLGLQDDWMVLEAASILIKKNKR